MRMVAEVRPSYPSQWAAIVAVKDKLGIGTAETLRHWVRQAEVDAGSRPGVTTGQAEEVAKLKREVAELRPARATVIAFIGEHKDSTVGGLRWGVEPMCTVLTEHGIEISPSTYYEWAAKTPTARQVRDEEVVAVMVKERTTKPLVAALGSRKMWLYLRGKGHDVAR